MIRIEEGTNINVEDYGNKAYGLVELTRVKAEIPVSYCLAKDEELTSKNIHRIKQELGSDIIIRSSTSIEDSDNNNYPGLFDSIRCTIDDIVYFSNRIRQAALKSANSMNIQLVGKIPLIIQAYISGFGGVYLRNYKKEFESLEISSFGASSITSGHVNNNKIINTNDVYHNVLMQCRQVSDQLGTNSDLEFQLSSNKLIFLQYRKHVSAPYIPPNELSGWKVNEYFPYPLPQLISSIWLDVLKAVGFDQFKLHRRHIYSRIEEKSDMKPCSSKNIYSNEELTAAEDYYKNILFPTWDHRLHNLKKNTIDVKKRFLNTYYEWRKFLIEYFSNPYEDLISNVANTEPSGISRSPLNSRWSYALKEWFDSDFIIKEELLLFSDFGYRFIGPPTYLNRVTISELLKLPNSLSFVQDLKATAKHSQILQPISDPTIETRIAWLAEDDNEYKHKFGQMLRFSILALEIFLESERQDKKTDTSIWNADIIDLISYCDGTSNKIELLPVERISANEIQLTDDSLETTRRIPGSTFAGSGMITGEIATIHTFRQGVGQILLVHSLDSTSYPIAIGACAIIVSIGSMNSHASIFARDHQIPLFQSLAATSFLKSGDLITIDLTNEFIEKG